MKRLTVVLFFSILLVSVFFTGLGFFYPSIAIKYNGADIYFPDEEPTAYDGGKNMRIIAPVDLLAVKMDATVKLDDTGSTATIKKGADTITFFNEKAYAVVNGRERQLVVPARISEGHVYASANFLGESLGKLVYWESRSSSLNIVDIDNRTLIFNELAKDYVSIEKFLVNSEKFTFKKTADQKPSEAYILGEKLNPNINRQLFNLVKVLVDKSYYLNVGYDWTNRNDEPLSSAYVGIAETKGKAMAGEYNVLFSLFDKIPANPKKDWNYKAFSANAVVRLDISKLSEEEGNKNAWIDNFYESKLKLALITLFQESTGLNIYDYLSEEYKKLKNDMVKRRLPLKKARRFDNIKVDLVRIPALNGADSLCVYFSYQQ